MHHELTAALIEYFASNRAAGGRRDYYGVRVDGVAAGRSEFDLTLTFKAGESYCCAEPGCHTGFHDSECWRRLRQILGFHGLVGIPPVTIRRLGGVVEIGALLRCNLAFGYPERERLGYTFESGPHHERMA
jgi:hypothetical protein